jgi:hypothetical protein
MWKENRQRVTDVFDHTRNSELFLRFLAAGRPRGSRSECFSGLAHRESPAVRCGSWCLHKTHVEAFPRRNRDHRCNKVGRDHHQECPQQKRLTGVRLNRPTTHSMVLGVYLDLYGCQQQAPRPKLQSFPSRLFRDDNLGYPLKGRSNAHLSQRLVNQQHSLPDYCHCPTLPRLSAHYRSITSSMACERSKLSPIRDSQIHPFPSSPTDPHCFWLRQWPEALDHY